MYAHIVRRFPIILQQQIIQQLGVFLPCVMNGDSILPAGDNDLCVLFKYPSHHFNQIFVTAMPNDEQVHGGVQSVRRYVVALLVGKAFPEATQLAFREMGSSHMNDQRFHDHAHLIDLRDIAQRNIGDQHALLGQDSDKAILFQTIERFADRRAAVAQFRADFLFIDHCTGVILAVNDLFLNFPISPLSQVFRRH